VKSKGFTLLEVLIVIGFIGLMSALLLPNFTLGKQSLALNRSAAKLSQDLRRAQEMALSAKEVNGAIPSGYGIFFDLDYPNQYFFFADMDGDDVWDEGETIETVVMENMVVINDLSLGSSLSVVFSPPNPDVHFSSGENSASISLIVSDVESYKYSFIHVSYVWDQLLTPRASCDIGDRHECPSSFSALAGDPPIVYDQIHYSIQFMGSTFWYIYSYKYEKQEPVISGPFQKNIDINSIGLIEVN